MTTRSVIAWIVVLFILTGLGVLWLWATGVDPSEGFSPAIILIAYASSLAALIVALAAGGGGAVVSLLRQILLWRVGIQWYALALVGPLALVAVAHLLHIAVGGAPPPSWFDVAGLVAGIGPLIAGCLGEEYGWRGFAQPLLQRHFRPVWASVIVGVVWATWHIWPIAAPGGAAHAAMLVVVLAYVRMIATAVVYGWLYNATRGSLLVVMLAHAAHNIALDLMPLPADGDAVAILIALLYAAAAGVVIWGDRRRMLARPLSSAAPGAGIAES